jgi:benzoate 4-monooxygenase
MTSSPKLCSFCSFIPYPPTSPSNIIDRTAGSDTTANSSAAILYHILKNPIVHSRLLAELPASIKVEGKIPTHDEVRNLPYLNACIDEGLRMFATNAFGLPRVVPEGTTVSFEEIEESGMIFGPGVELSAPAYSFQHSPLVWGSDSNTFNPDRFLENPDLKKHLLTFGLGPRACIGKNLAYFQMQLLVALIVGRYGGVELRDAELRSVEGFMHKPVDLWVKLRR